MRKEDNDGNDAEKKVDPGLWEFTTCLFARRSALNNYNLFACHLENIQWSVDATVLSMPSTDLIGTQDRQLNHEINSLCATEHNSFYRSYQVVIADEGCVQVPRVYSCYSTCREQRFSPFFHTVCRRTHTRRHVSLLTRKKQAASSPHLESVFSSVVLLKHFMSSYLHHNWLIQSWPFAKPSLVWTTYN